MPFLSFSNVKVKFVKKLEKLIQISYGTTKALSTTNRVKLINKQRFTKQILNKKSKSFMIYITILKTEITNYQLQNNSDSCTIVE